MKPLLANAVAPAAEQETITSARTEGLTCPKCNALMELVTVDSVTIDRCTRCRGMWFDAHEQKILKERNSAEQIDIGDPAVGKRMDKIHDIHCPRCGVQMMRMVHVDQASIDYEACPNCYGIFLDAGEFKELRDTTISDYLAALFEPHKKNTPK